MHFLQITTTDSLTTAADSLTTQNSVSLLDLTLKGGIMMIPIFILSIVAVYIFVERLMKIRKASQNPTGLMERVKSLVLNGDIVSARLLCEQTDTPIAR